MSVDLRGSEFERVRVEQPRSRNRLVAGEEAPARDAEFAPPLISKGLNRVGLPVEDIQAADPGQQSMIGFALRPGIAVDPICWTSR